ncbi:superkiller complex protein 3-like isoform X2 [Lycorma delicatula]|uniref:superkiller complex protein 3-like isoform X2 n=1 Tax=Lycorma delicatula TaxID=130591 RepID=UPI003F514F8A
MDPKVIKSLLKEAKEATFNKNFEHAVKLCKDVLKVDRNNYMALVLLGAAMQETDQKDQAPKAFRKAVELMPDHILAWQGLASYYEIHNEDSCNDFLPTVYQKLLNLESDTIKWCGIFKKFVEFTLKNGEISEFIDCVKEHKNTYIHEKKEVMWPDVVTILTTAKDLEDSHIPLTEAISLYQLM